jgi:hypothetical protein
MKDRGPDNREAAKGAKMDAKKRRKTLSPQMDTDEHE